MWIIEQRKTLQSEWNTVGYSANCGDAQEIAKKIGLRDNTYMRVSFLEESNNVSGVYKKEKVYQNEIRQCA